MGTNLDLDDVAAQSEAAAKELAELRNNIREAAEVLSKLAAPGWVTDAISSGEATRISREICGLKREARAVLAEIQGSDYDRICGG